MPLGIRYLNNTLMKLRNLLWVYLGLMGMFFSCQKGEEFAKPTEKKVVRLNLQGYIMRDTLEFLKEGQVLCEAYETNFNMVQTPGVSPTVSATELQVRKKGSLTVLDTLFIKEEPFDQIFRIFYDGNSLSDNIEITPVSGPGKVGMRVSLQANSAYMTEGNVDIEIFEKVFAFFPDGTSSETYESLYTLKNVGSEFSDFLELPAITFDDPMVYKSYVFKVYQAGTKNYPFKEGVLFNQPVETIYGDLYLSDGQSALLQIVPSFTENTFDFYNANDIAQYFQ